MGFFSECTVISDLFTRNKFSFFSTFTLNEKLIWRKNLLLILAVFFSLDLLQSYLGSKLVLNHPGGVSIFSGCNVSETSDTLWVPSNPFNPVKSLTGVLTPRRTSDP
jgi:hypothetical protein